MENLTITMKRWTKEEIKYLKRSYQKQGAKHTAKHLNRSVPSVIAKTMRLGIVKEGFRRWNDWENRYIKRHYSDRKPQSIAKVLKRSKHAVQNRAKKLGITNKRAKLWTEEEKEYLRKHYPDRKIQLKEIASHLNRSITSLHSYAKYINVSRPRHNHEWSNEEHEYLVKNYKKKRFKDIAKNLGLSADAVVLYANRNNIFRRNPIRYWTENDLEYVRQHYSVDTAEDIGKVLGRTIQAIRACGLRLGLQGMHNQHKPANIAARVYKFKLWLEQKDKKR